MARMSFSDGVLLAGGISVFLYFVYFPFVKQAIPNADTLGLEIWFLIVGIVLIIIGIFAKWIKHKLSS